MLINPNIYLQLLAACVWFGLQQCLSAMQWLAQRPWTKVSPSNTSLRIKVTQQQSFPKMSNCPTHSKGLHKFHYDPQIMSYRFHQVSINVLFMFILFHLSKQSQDNTYLMKDRFTLLVSLYPHWSSKDTNTIVHQELK